MAYLVLALKYRPQTLEQVLGQDHITQTIGNSILNNRVAHSILFSGPRGSGKTTVARILAKAINCKAKLKCRPCNECDSCIDVSAGKGADVVEIDGASNNSVEQVRNLQGNILYMPASARSKIYIIDEVHMLSIAAFNALLKTLEEPPKHVMFILATTEYHKVPATITSRCQHHRFKRIKAKTIQAHLTHICNKESFKLTPESLWTISAKSDGSMRDALSSLDQIMSRYDNNASHDQVINVLGTINIKLIHTVTKAILARNTVAVLNNINYAYMHGQDLKLFYTDMMEHFKDLLILKIGGDAAKLVNLPTHEIRIMQEQIEHINSTHIDQVLSILSGEELYINNANQIKLAVEIAFLKLHNIQPALSIDTLIEKLDDIKNIKTPSKEKKPNPSNGTINKNLTQLQHNDLSKTWEEIQNIISESRPSLAASLSYCSIHETNTGDFEIEITNNEYTVKALEKNLSFLRETFKKHTGIENSVFLRNNVKKNNQILKQNKPDHTQIMDHSLVVDAVKIFNGKVEDIITSPNTKE